MCTYESHIACHILVGPFLIYTFAIYGRGGGAPRVPLVVRRNLMLRPYCHVSAGWFRIGSRALGTAWCVVGKIEWTSGGKSRSFNSYPAGGPDDSIL